MSIRGSNFNNQEFRAADHGAVFAKVLSDGWLTGGGVACSGQVVTIKKGLYIAKGRVFELDADYPITISRNSGFARIKFTLSMSATSTESKFEVVKIATEYATSATGFADLQSEEINRSGVIYEAAIALITLGASHKVHTNYGEAKISSNIANGAITKAMLSSTAIDQLRKEIVRSGTTAVPTDLKDGQLYVRYS